MKIFANFRLLVAYGFMSGAALFLTGCVNYSVSDRAGQANYFFCEIVSQDKSIPENAMITITLSQRKSDDEKETVWQQYLFTTQKISKSVTFRLKYPDAPPLLPLSASVRVEKSGQLILMSNKVQLIPARPGEKLVLTLVDH